MLLRVPAVLDATSLAAVRAIVLEADWVDGRVTAGTQSATVKNNRQLPEEGVAARRARAIVQEQLAKHALFLAAALPKRIFPPLFNCYAGEANAFGNHVDNALRTSTASGMRLRTDLSATLFLCEPGDYDGGELVIDDTLATQRLKLAAGDLLLYPASSVHRVEPVTRGVRYASFFWIESLVRETERRRLLFDLDMSILELRRQHGECPQVLSLTGCYHNLLRMWADS